MARVYIALVVFFSLYSAEVDAMVLNQPFRMAPPAFSRDLSDITLDLNYTLNVPDSHWGAASERSFANVMHQLHGRNIWQDPNLEKHTRTLGIHGGEQEIYGSTLQDEMMIHLIKTVKPRLFLEVGVFRGSTSIAVARTFENTPELQNSFVISMDTWLLDVRFVWNAPGSESPGTGIDYFKNTEVGGSSQMYFIFLDNCRAANLTHRIVPVQTASSNGAMALIAHKIRPDLMYIDASHSNPDVYVDFENFYKILRPGGAMAFDDLDRPPVGYAIDSLVQKYGLSLIRKGHQGYISKPSH